MVTRIIGPAAAGSAGPIPPPLEGEVEQEYDEVMVGGEGGVASDPTYMEVGTGGGGGGGGGGGRGGGGRGNTFELKENEAYGTHLSA